MSPVRRRDRAVPYVRRALSRALPRGVILCYHRIAAPDGDPQGLAVAPERFADHLDVLAAEGHPVLALGDLEAAIRHARPPRGAVAITFDDGYADNLHVAAPQLGARGMPATVFVTTRWVRDGAAAWWDELERHFRAPHAGAPVVAGVRRPVATADERAATYRSLLSELAALAAHERDHALAALRGWSGVDGAPEAGRGPLTAAEVAGLAALAHIDVGAHTYSHPSLAQRPAVARDEELVTGRDEIAMMTGAVPRHFAYPFGARGRDYDAATRAAVGRAGFTAAVTTDPGPVSRLTPALELQRVLVGDLDAEGFAARLRRAFAV